MAARPLLWSDAFDFFGVGGASLAVPLALAFALRGGAYHGGDWLFGPSQAAWFLLILPHYTSSYQLLYWDYARDITQRLGHFLAAVAVPVGCAAALGCVFSGRPIVPLSWLVHGLFFLSGWHYAKQAYGCALALSAAKGLPIPRPAALAARVNLLALSAWSFVGPNVQDRVFPYGGLAYRSLGLPPWTSWLCGLAVAGSALALAALLRRRPPFLACAAFLSFYAWAAPLVAFPRIFHAFRDVPFVAALHSLQYLTFVVSLRLARAPEPRGFSLDEFRPRLGLLASFVAVAALGHALFILLPRWADAALAYDRAALGATFFASAAALFVNVHHYFIDSVVWRGNPELRALVVAKAG